MSLPKPVGVLQWDLRRRRAIVVAAALVVAVVAASCGGGGDGDAAPSPTPTPGSPEVQPSPGPAPTTPVGSPPAVDTSIHSVPLEKIVFDTFDGGFAPLSEASPRLIERLRDAIRPIYQPRYEGPEGGAWLRPTDLVIGYEGETAAFAYPVKILNFNELVNDTIDGVPLLITYCPLCASGVVYDRRLDGQALVFGNTSALFENDLVMFDHQTGSYWFQVAGQAVVGPLTDRRLEPLPAVTVSWSQWLELHPDTRVLSRDQGLGLYPYEQDPFQGYDEIVDRLQFPFPVSTDKLDSRLRPSAIVISVRVGDQEKAYPLERLGDAVVNDTLEGEPIVVFSRSQGPTGSAFSARLDGRVLTFRLQDDQVRDQETGSRWDVFGRAVEGPLQGQSLELLPMRRAFWFSLSLASPGIALYQP